MLDALSSDDKLKIRSLFDEGVQTLRTIEDLREGLKEAVKAVAEELDIKPTEINKALRLAYKQSFEEEQDRLSTIAELLEVAGRS